MHALDGEEGAALQRLIRAMSCKFLALSGTSHLAPQRTAPGPSLPRVEKESALPLSYPFFAFTATFLEPAPPLTCPFFAFNATLLCFSRCVCLAATVGNAEQLRGWLQSVKEEQLEGVATLTVAPEETHLVPKVPPAPYVNLPLSLALYLVLHLALYLASI